MPTQCTTPCVCVFYQETLENNKPKIKKQTCNYKETDLKNIPEDEQNNCKCFKSFKDIKKRWKFINP